MQWKDIDLDKRTLSITKQITDRNGSIKNVRFLLPKTQSSIRPQILVDDLKAMKSELKTLKELNDNFFVTGSMFPVATNTINNHKNKNSKLANVKQIRLHGFRHSCTSLFINKGANVKVVAKY